jgi:hypothetical protein
MAAKKQHLAQQQKDLEEAENCFLITPSTQSDQQHKQKRTAKAKALNIHSKEQN